MKTSAFIMILLLFILHIPHLAEAQNEKELNVKTWLDIGLGFSRAEAGPETAAGGGLAGRTALHIQINRVVISGFGTINTGGKSDYDVLFFRNMNDLYWDTGLLLGYPVVSSDGGQLVISSGLALSGGRQVKGVSVDDCEWFCSEAELVPVERVYSVPMEVAFYSRGTSALGYAVVSHINFNPNKVFAAITINLMLGNRD